MPNYESWEELCDAAQKRCHDILERDVAPVAIGILKKHIQSDIYDVYEPKPGGWVNGTTYKRRHLLGGSVFHKFIHDDEILITSEAKVSKPIVKGSTFHHRRPGAFLQLLESGNMGIWRSGFPRPAVKNAQDEINKSADIRSAIRTGISRYF